MLGGQVLEIRRRWQAVQVRWTGGNPDESPLGNVSQRPRLPAFAGPWQPCATTTCSGPVPTRRSMSPRWRTVGRCGLRQ
jgi:hypothetical protein